MYFYLATTEIPLTTLTVDVSSTVYLTMEPDTFPTDGLADCGPDDIAVAESATTASTTLNMELTFPIYVSAMLGFVGEWNETPRSALLLSLTPLNSYSFGSLHSLSSCFIKNAHNLASLRFASLRFAWRRLVLLRNFLRCWAGCFAD